MEEDIKGTIERIEKKLERKVDYDTGVWLAQTDIENLLTRYKQLEEQNKKMEELIENAECDMSVNYIRKSKAKEKIEEYDKQRIKMEKDDIGIGFTLGKEWSDLKAKIEVLQELLEEE